MQPRFSYIYIISQQGMLKLGYSHSMTLKQQLSRYRTYYPRFGITVYDIWSAKERETEIKNAMKPFNLKGEIFTLNAYEPIQQYIRSQHGFIMYRAYVDESGIYEKQTYHNDEIDPTIEHLEDIYQAEMVQKIKYKG